jgi:DNA polymerase III sliding clamp (beta) subunit (PCNA family)
MRIDKAVLSLRHVASTDDTRLNLSGIYLTAAEACATDGHMLARIAQLPAEAPTEPAEGEAPPSPEPELKACIIATADAIAIDKAIPKPNRYGPSVLAELDTEHTNSNGHLRVTIGATEMKPAKVEGEFPDYAQVLPKGPATFRVGLNANYLAQLVKVARAANENGKPDTIVLEFYDNLADVETKMKGYCQAIGVKAPGSPRFSGLLMPIRCD